MFLGVVSIGSINVRDCYSFRFFIYTIILQVSSRSSNTVNTATIFLYTFVIVFINVTACINMK